MKRAVKMLLRFALRWVAWFFVLILISQLAAGFGVALGVNAFNASVLTVLGLPGLGLLLMLKWITAV